MLKIWSMKQQQQQAENAAGAQKKKKVTAAQLRVQKGACQSPMVSDVVQAYGSI
jgi:ubiquitin-conjugating enzyme E2 M